MDRDDLVHQNEIIGSKHDEFFDGLSLADICFEATGGVNNVIPLDAAKIIWNKTYPGYEIYHVSPNLRFSIEEIEYCDYNMFVAIVLVFCNQYNSFLDCSIRCSARC